MSKKFSREQFLKIADGLREEGPEVRYQNPDAWITHVLKKMIDEEKEKMQRK